MARFSDLPNELVITVWHHVLDPEAIESFALVSKKVYALGSSFIAEHNELKREFSCVAHSTHDIITGIITRPADTLKELLLRPRTALYVRNVFIDDWRSYWIKRRNPEFTCEHAEYPEQDMELFRQAIKDSPLILEDEITDWVENLENGDEEVIFSLFFTLIPNVHSLNLFRMGSEGLRLSNTIQRIAGSRDTEALSRLTVVQLWKGYDVVFRYVDLVHIFSALPSVKAIEAWSVGNGRHTLEHEYAGSCYGCGEGYQCRCNEVCHDDRGDLQFTLPPKTSAVKHLTFGRCSIEKDRLFEFLEGLQALENFGVDTCCSMDPSDIVSALLAHAKKSLRTLRFGTCYNSMLCTIDLTEFEVLQELEIESDLMRPYKHTVEEGYSYLYLMRPYKDAAEGSTLADRLPPSIERICLRRLHTHVPHSVENDVLEMTIDKAERLPNLKELTIELIPSENTPDAKAISRMKRQFEGVGVLLTVTVKLPVTISPSPSIKSLSLCSENNSTGTDTGEVD